MTTATTSSSPAGCNIGTYSLHVGDNQYVCTSLSFSMAMDNIPSVRVTIGCGKSLKDAKGKMQDPEDLLKTILAKHGAAYLDMLDCSIVESLEAEKLTIPIFEGCIVAASPVYKAGAPTTRMISILVMNRACKLYTRPLSAYVSMNGSYLRSSIVGNTRFDIEAARLQAKKNTALLTDREAINDMLNKLPASLDKATVIDRVASIVDAIIDSESLSDKVKPSSQDAKTPSQDAKAPAQAAKSSGSSGILNYMFGSAKLDLSRTSTLTGSSFNIYIAQLLVHALANASIYDALQRILVSTAVMLNIIPRWKHDDYKLELAPSSAWDPGTPITLEEKHIIGISTEYNPIANLNTPEGFIVNFSNVFQLQNAKAGTEIAAGCNGVFASNPEVMAYLRFKAQGKTSPSHAAYESTLFRVGTYDAPPWLLPAALAEKSSKDKSTVETHKQPTTSKHAEASTEQKDKLDRDRTIEIADTIAKSLFTYIYGSQDKAVVTIYPSMRFGLSTGVCFEENLGNAIDIEFGKDNPRNIRGILESIQYEYTAGESSSVSYTLTLKCVRPLDKNEKAIPCPLYTKKTQ